MKNVGTCFLVIAEQACIEIKASEGHNKHRYFVEQHQFKVRGANCRKSLIMLDKQPAKEAVQVKLDQLDHHWAGTKFQCISGYFCNEKLFLYRKAKEAEA